MTEKTMERRRRYRQRHRRNTIATWVAGAACAAMLVFLAAMGCRDYVNKLPPPESSTFPGLALSETKQGTPDPTIQDSQPQEIPVHAETDQEDTVQVDFIIHK